MPKHQLDKFSDLTDKNGRFKIFFLFMKISQICEFLLIGPSPDVNEVTLEQMLTSGQMTIFPFQVSK